MLLDRRTRWTLFFLLLSVTGLAFGQEIELVVPPGIEADPETDPIGFWVALGIWIIQIALWLAVAWALLYFVAKLADGIRMWWADRDGAAETVGRIGGSVVVIVMILAAAVFANGFLNQMRENIDEAVAMAPSQTSPTTTGQHA
ncbi:MAG: hypothetical protein AAGI11_22940 [Pseudomonadota bacterium]